MTRGWSPRTRLALGALLAVALVALAGCSYSPPPSLCPVCDETVSHAAAERGATVTVAESEFHLYLRSDGSARGEARVRLEGEGVAAFRTNASLREAVVRERFADNGGPIPDRPADLSASMDGDTLVVTFADPGLADAHAGPVLVVDQFHHQSAASTRPPFRLRADRMVLHAPDDWTVVNQPTGATVRSDAVVWTDDVDEGTYVVLGTDDSAETSAMGQLAVGAEVASWSIEPWLGATTIPVLVLGGLLVRLLGRVEHEPPRESDLAVNGSLVGALTVTGLALVAVAVVVVMAHDLERSTRALGVLCGFAVLSSFVAGGAAHRRPAVRWPPAVLAAGAAPLAGLWLVLAGGGAGTLAALFLLGWTAATAPLSALAFRIGRDAAVSPGERPAVDAVDGDEGDADTRKGEGRWW